jgi:hypothetical protein
MEFEALTEKIIRCAFRVYSHMGLSFLESVCEKSFVNRGQPPILCNRSPAGVRSPVNRL